MNATPTTSPSKYPTRRILTIVGVGIIVVFGLLQIPRFVVPELKLDNPPSTMTIAWDSPKTQQLWQQTCADCHSNDTVYPWYAYVPPIGWLVARDTHEGRDAVNISVDRRVEGDEMIEKIRNGEMPPAIYTTIHTNAILNDADKKALIDGLQATFGG